MDLNELEKICLTAVVHRPGFWKLYDGLLYDVVKSRVRDDIRVNKGYTLGLVIQFPLSDYVDCHELGLPGYILFPFSVTEADKRKIAEMKRRAFKEVNSEREISYGAEIKEWLVSLPAAGEKIPQDKAADLADEGLRLIMTGQANGFDRALDRYQSQIISKTRGIISTSLEARAAEEYWSSYMAAITAGVAKP